MYLSVTTHTTKQTNILRISSAYGIEARDDMSITVEVTLEIFPIVIIGVYDRSP